MQQALHSLRAAFAQLLGQLPAVPAFYWCQQARKVAVRPLAHLGPPKMGGQPCMQRS